MTLRQFIYIMGGLWFAGLCLSFCGCRTILPPEGVAPVEHTMRVTGYCDCGRCCNWERTCLMTPVSASGVNKGKPKQVGVTASGAPVRVGTVAADGDLFPFGTIVYVEGYGYGRVEDRGALIKGNRLDLYFPTHRAAKSWGARMIKVKIWFPKPGKIPLR